MEFLTIISLILSIYAVVKVSSITQSKTPSSILPQQPSKPEPYIPETTLIPSQETTTKAHPGAIDQLWQWFVLDWPLKTGALFILLGFVWLLTYAFLHNWIGEQGRIACGLITGLLILYGGDHRLNTYRSQGVTLVGLGVGIISLSLYAASEVYHIFPAMLSLGLLLLSMSITSVISLKHRVQSLAVSSLLISGLAPFMMSPYAKDMIGLLLYILLVVVSVVWLARYSKWRLLILVSMGLVVVHSFTYMTSSYDTLLYRLTPGEMIWLRFFAITFISIFLSTSIASIMSTRSISAVDIQIAMGVGIFTVGWINGIVPESYKSIMTVLATMVFVFAAYGTYMKTMLKSAVYVYTGISFVLLAIATAYAFDGPVLVIAYSVQALVLPILGDRIFEEKAAHTLYLYYILPFLVSLNFIPVYQWETDDWRTALYALTSVTCVFLCGGLYRYYQKRAQSSQLHSISIFLILLGGGYGLLWIWRTFHLFIESYYVAQMTILTAYVVMGLYTYLRGEVQHRIVLKRFGLALLIFVVARLLLIEIWDMELSMRIVTFFGIGMLFIGSVLGKKYIISSNRI